MARISVLWVLALTTLIEIYAVHIELQDGRRTVHRLIGGHLKSNGKEFSDAELMTASETGGKDAKQKSDGGEEEKKTLAQQVADGKYGLIQKELFSKPVKRPGIISYDSNSEVPKDTINNLGGLSKNDIWLAENHLLVIKGGAYPPHEDHQDNSPPVWPPIDNYVAPQRQVKIPSNPKVPPPFPVQLTENGPIQILGTNSSRTINVSLESPPYSILPPEGFFPDGPFFPPPYPNSPNATSGETPFPIPPFPPAVPGDFYPGNGPNPFPINGTLPPYFANLPPGAVFLPPPGNQSEPIDEDDPSIYYPPPYSFYFPKDNSSLVPPGPLVPGIVLPPPPNFFAPLEEPTTKKRIPIKKPTTTTSRPIPPITTTTPIKQIHPTTTPLPPTSVVNNTPFYIPPQSPHIINNALKPKPPKVVTIYPIHPTQKLNNTIAATTTTKPYVPVVRHPAHRKKPPSVTILKPVKTSSTPSPNYYYENNEVSGKPFDVYGPPPSRNRGVVSTTQVPLKVYFSTSNNIESNSVTQQPKTKLYPEGRGISTIHSPKTTKSPAQYYYYEEEGATTKAPPPNQNSNVENNYFNIPKHYLIRAKPASRPQVEVEIQQIEAQLPEDRYRAIQQQNAQVQNVNYNPSQVHLQNSEFNKQHNIQNQPSFVQQKPKYVPGPPKYVPSPTPTYSQQPNINVQDQQQYYYVSNRPYTNDKGRVRFIQTTKRPDTFGLHIARIKEQIENYYTTEKPYVRNVYQNTVKPSSKPVYQFSFEAANYKQQQDAYRDSRIEDQNDKFRPLPHYSVQIQPAVEIIPTEGPPVYRNTPLPVYFRPKQTNSQKTPVQYYSTPRPEYDYENQSPNNQASAQYTATPRPINQYTYEATPNPVYQQNYYTRQEEGYFDDITKKYFTMFGKKLPGVTTPLAYAEATTLNPVRKPYQIQYAQSIRKPVSLQDDTLVNYVQPRPSINPDSEYIQLPQQVKYVPQEYNKQQTPLHSDINVNYKVQRPTPNPNAEIIRAINVPLKVSNNADGKGGSFISYQLPGDDGAHFYFLTPQLAQRRDQGAGFYYSQQPNAGTRVRRDNNVKES